MRKKRRWEILLRDRFQNGFRRSIVAEGFADVGHKVHIARSEDETSTKLERIFAQLVLAMPAGLRPLSRQRIVFTQQMKQCSFLQAQRPIRLSLLIDQQWKLDSCLLTKRTGIVSIAQPHSRQCRSLGFELLLVFAQLRNMLAAEDSTIVAEENHDCRMFSP